ncbi:MAG: biopolymer transport protein ExbD [Porticoccaceae bacterium]
MNLDLQTTRRRSVISLTPLIDVVFILLLFFMLASNFSQERSVSWNSVGEGRNLMEDLPLESSRIYLQAAQRYVLDGITMSQAPLLEALAARHVANPLHSVVVSVSEEIDVQTLLDLIASIKNTGVEKVVMDASGTP